MNIDGQLWRPVRDLIAHRLTRSRGSQWGPHLRWSSELPLRESVSADSIDLVDAGDAVLRLFSIDELGWGDALLMHPSIGGWARIAAGALSAEGALRFASSGSQGEPAEHPHRLEALLAESRHLGQIVEGRIRVVCAVPTHHIYGFIFGVLLPEFLGCEVVDTCGLPPASLERELRPGDLLVAHPLLWSRLLESGFKWPEDVVGASSTAPIDPAVVSGLRANGLRRLIEVYGSSETAGIGWRDETSAAFTLFPRWQGADEEFLIACDGGRFPLPDIVAVDGRSIRPLGRRDRAVQVAGTNVYPDRVARTLEQAPGVASAQVRLDARSGRLKARIMSAAGTSLDQQQLRAWCIARLSAAECPSEFTFTDDHSTNELGKSADW